MSSDAAFQACRHCRLVSLVVLISLAAESLWAADSSRDGSLVARFRIELPKFVLTDVPVRRVELQAVSESGQVDRSFQSAVVVDGISLEVDGRARQLPAFRDGRLVLETDLAAGRRVYITQRQIRAEHRGFEPSNKSVVLIWRWLSLVPPLLAIFLAVWWRRVLPALFLAILAGAVVLCHGNVLIGSWITLKQFLVDELLQPGDPDKSHILIVLFTSFLGALIGVMSRSGGTGELVRRLAPLARTRERAQGMTCLMGLVVFFDDYANTLLLGGTLRPVTDRLRVSREKLAFLVDATAAPVAGLALISTWVGFEIGQISEAFQSVDIDANAFSVFVATVPYRFYAIYLLVFVWWIALTGRDFGPMLRAEQRAVEAEGDSESEQPDRSDEAGDLASVGRRPLVRNALIPLGALIAFLLFGLWWSGNSALAVQNLARRTAGAPATSATVFEVLQAADSNRVLFGAALAASLVAVLGAVTTHALTVVQAAGAWLLGVRSMLGALTILLLAWGVASVCDPEHLNTDGFLVEITRGALDVRWMPTLAFLLAAGVSFATGSSFSTMGLLIPLFVAVTCHLLAGTDQVDPHNPLMLATIGAVLAGAIFGDHCSPISDTTVLSSAASGCHHLQHVMTQMPYAACVAGIALVFGYIPVGFGMAPWLLIPVSAVAMGVVVFRFGRRVRVTSPQHSTRSADEMP